MKNSNNNKAFLAGTLLGLVAIVAPSAMAQGLGTTGTTPGTGSVPAVDITRVDNLINQGQSLPSPTVIPTDTLPLPGVQNRLTFAENFQLRLLQRLPARFYFNGTCETSFRYETNPYQFPTKRALIGQLPPPSIIRQLNGFQQQQINDLLGLCGNDDIVFRVLPNVTAGWTITPRTRAYCNYFLIRDQLAHNVRLNTVIQSIGGGLQRDIPVTSRGNLQAEFQFRELYQTNQQPVFDFLPGLTFSYVATPRIVLFANAILQMRGKAFFQAPTKELDPFYTWGGLYQRNGWTFSASTTLVQNFREPFRANATIPVNNYSFICDFEISRRVIKALPGLQAFLRAEPIYNFHSHDTPGLAGMDFRFFWGLRMAVAKPALTSALQQLRQQLEEQEGPAPQQQPEPNKENKENNKESKPSAMLPPHEIIASSPQPIHGFMATESLAENRTVLVSHNDTLHPDEPQNNKSSRNDIRMLVVPPFPELQQGQLPDTIQSATKIIPGTLH